MSDARRSSTRRDPPAWLGEVRAITFDFGNTLVPVHAEDLARVVDRTAAWAAERWHGFAAERFREVWREERERQFLEDVPRMREADLDRRAIRVLARLRGHPTPDPASPWDDALAETFSDRAEVSALLHVYADAFITGVTPPPAVGPMLSSLARDWRLGLISNWPLAVIVERYLEAAGWRDRFDAVVVSQAIGWIKPDRRIFEAAAAELRIDDGRALLHVGDDLGADVAGAKDAGWWACWLRDRPADSPLPSAAPRPEARPDLVVDALPELPAALGCEDAVASLGDGGRAVGRRP